jgi:hypothetical protein
VNGSGTGGGDVVGQGNNTNTGSGSVTVPYDQVYSGYADSAYQAVDNGGYPLNLQNVIKQYFTSLAP